MFKLTESDIDDVFKSTYIAIITNIQKCLGKGSGWIIDTVIDHTISTSRYNPLAGSSFIKLPEDLDHPRKGLISIQNTDDDNACFKWCLIRHFTPADYHSARFAKADKDFVIRLDYEDIKCPLKTRYIQKIEKKNTIGISVFGYEDKIKYPTYVSKKCC